MLASGSNDPVLPPPPVMFAAAARLVAATLVACMLPPVPRPNSGGLACTGTSAICPLNGQGGIAPVSNVAVGSLHVLCQAAVGSLAWKMCSRLTPSNRGLGLGERRSMS